MKRKRFYLFVIIMVMLLIIGTVLNQETFAEEPDPTEFAGGSGTAEDPYLIETAEHLGNIRNHQHSHFRQISDINLGTAPWNEGEGWEPITYMWSGFKYPFYGSFNGNGYSIISLYINRPDEDEVGLFAVAGGAAGSSLYNVTLVDAEVTGNNRVGALVGRTFAHSITNCTAAGSVEGNDNVGGLVGYIGTTTVTTCSFNGSVTGNDYTGGLVGRNENSDIHSSNTEVTVTGNEYVGGQFGIIYATGNPAPFVQLVNCSSAGSVMGVELIGGLAGEIVNTVNLDNCYSSADVIGVQNVGGLVGSTLSGSISNSYATGDVNGKRLVGGLVGMNNLYSIITNSFAAGDQVIGNYSEPDGYGYSNAGGLVGGNYGQISNCFALPAVVGENTVGGLVGYNSPEGMISSCYATGGVSGETFIGGLVGLNSTDGIITFCYSIGNISHLVSHNSYSIGGLVGYNYNTEVDSIYASYYDSQTSGRSDTGKGIPKTTAEMQEGAPSADIYTDWSEEVWIFAPTNKYPRLLNTYRPGAYKISIVAEPEEGGTLSGGGFYDPGDEVSVTAKASPGWVFFSWTEDGTEVHDEAEYTFIITADRDLAANFRPLNSDADLSALSVIPGALVPDFDPDTIIYTVDVAHDVAAIDVTATLSDDKASMTIGGEPADSGVAETVSLSDPGEATEIDIIIAAEDGTTQNTYTITVNRAEEPLFQPISNLEVGDKIIDLNWEWEYNPDYSMDYEMLSSEGGDTLTETVSWIVVAKNHPGYPENSITLVSEYLVASQPFALPGEGWDNGKPHWFDSDVRNWLNSTFYGAFPNGLKAAVLPTTLTTAYKESQDGDVLQIQSVNNVFLLSVGELGDGSAIEGPAISYFDSGTKRQAFYPPGIDAPGDINEWNQYTRTQNDLDESNWDKIRLIQNSDGNLMPVSFPFYRRHLRPVINLSSDVMVSGLVNAEGYYEILEVFNISVSAAPEKGGTVSGEGNYALGALVTVEATANPGYEFVNWIEDGTEVHDQIAYTFTAEADRDLVANFIAVTSGQIDAVVLEVETGVEYVEADLISWGIAYFVGPGDPLYDYVGGGPIVGILSGIKYVDIISYATQYFIHNGDVAQALAAADELDQSIVDIIEPYEP